MRRLLVLATLLGVMIGLKLFLNEIDLESDSPLTLAAIGFVVLASFTVGELVATLSIPKITGYILSGVVFGPQLSNILSHRIVSDMRVFNTLALGLIALTAGLELDVKATQKVFRTLMVTVAVKVPMLMLSVGGAFWLIETYHPLLGLPTKGAVVALALIFAVLAIGTSPSVSLAVINDSKAKGRMADLTLAMAVVKDLVVVVSLAVAIAVGRSFVSSDSHFNSGALVHVAKELGGSILFGSGLGFFLILYVRFFGKEMLLALVALVLLTAEASDALHLELLLVLIAAGFVVRNFSKFEHTLLTPLTRVSLPVFVVFFTTAGAGVDLQGTLKLLPLAAAMAGARAITFYIASAVGTRAGGERPAVRDNAWLAYIPQAGVTLGLVLLTARQLPELSNAIMSMGLAVVSINLLIGPVTLGIALRRAGDVARALTKPQPEPAPTASVAPAVTDALTSADPVPNEEPQPKPTLTLPNDPALELALVSAGDELKAQIETFWESTIEERCAASKLGALRASSDREGDERASQTMLRLLNVEGLTNAQTLAPSLDALERTLIATLESFPERLQVRLTPENFRAANDDFLEVKAVKLFTKALSMVRLYPRRRNVPIRLTMRLAFEKPMVDAVSLLGESLFLYELGLTEPLTLLAKGLIDAEECRLRLDRHEARWASQTKARIDDALNQGMQTGALWLDRLGGPGHPASEVRLSEVLPAIEAARKRRNQRLPRWQRLVAAAMDGLKATAALDAAGSQFRSAVERRCWAPLALVENEIAPLIQGVLQPLAELREDTNAQLSGKVGQTYTRRFEEILTKRERNRLTGLKAKYRHATQFSELLTDCSKIVETVPKELHPARDTTMFRIDADLADLRTDTLDLADALQEALIDRFVPRFAEALGPLSEHMADIDERVEAALAIAAFGMRALERSGDEASDELKTTIPEVLGRAHDQIQIILDEVAKSLEQARGRLNEASTETLSTLDTLLTSQAGAKDRLRASMGQTQQAARRAFMSILSRGQHWLRMLLSATMRLARRKNVPGWLFEARSDNMDPSGIRRILLANFKESETLSLPTSCRNGFSPDPIDDIRLVTARRGALEDLISHLQKGRLDSFTNVLITGARGAGRSSVINIVELRLARFQVVRLDPRFHHRSEGLLEAIAAELGCADDFASILDTVKRRRAVVLIDDLQHYVLPNEQGLASLQRFMELMVQSSPEARWIVSVGRTAYNLFQETLSLSQVFGRQLDLSPLGADDLRLCIETRARLAGVKLSYAPDGSRRAVEKRARDGYYRALAQATRGNLRHALLTHLRSLKALGEDRFLVRSDTRAALPFLARLGTDAMACLGFFIAYGPLSLTELASLMLVDEVTAARFVLPLRDASIVRAGEHGQTLFVPPHLDGPLQRGLEELGILTPETRP